MNPETLRKIFKSPFDYKTYSNEIVHRIFGCSDVATRPELLDTNAEGDKSHYIGQMEDADGRLLGFFYTRVADGGDVRRKRVGLRKLISPYLKYDVDGAIAIFDDGQHWRLSYICDLKEGSTSAKRFSYILGDEQGQYKTPIERLEKVAELKGCFKLSDLREAFSVDALSKEFFDEYHRHYDHICDYLSNLSTLKPSILHDYVKKMMGRIVFLHFLQKKRWLDDDPEFLKNLFFMQPLDRKADFLEQVLEPLFFGIFNTESDQREKLFTDEHWDKELLKQWEKLPYLNGGLFERDEVDKLKIKLPASLFEELFKFMASYNFTVDENDPDDAEVGVDPEMLGKIFESLLEDNKAKGAFYTPKEIVRYMCKESLIAYLSTQIDKSQSEQNDNSDSSDCDKKIRQFVETHEFLAELEPQREVIVQALREVKICDPAIGSGAFPMGLLNELWRCREAIEETASRVELKKDIIENNIYGVDIEKGAIDIARLRFWLSIVVDAEKPEPLPNFDYKFMQGNSLIESFNGHDLSHIMDKEINRNGKVVYQRRIGGKETVQVSMDFTSEDTRKNLQIWLKRYFSLTDHREKAEYRQRINDSVKSYIQQKGIGTDTEARLNALDPSANQDFFLWHTWFKDIFDKGGFDIVIGNPPYIQLQVDGGKLGELYKNCGFATYARTGDIYSLFYEQGWNILTKGGHLCYITSNKWMRAGYGEKTREFFTTKTNPKLLVDLGANVFENATVDTNILLYSRASNQGRTLSVTYFGDSLEKLSDFVQQNNTVNTFTGSDSWVILSEIEQSIKHKIEAVGTPLKNWDIQINYGIKTGFNDAFIITTEKREEILSACKDEEERSRTAELIRPILRGRDIKRYGYDWANLWLINTHNGVRGSIPRIDINDYPAIKQHLDRYWDKISCRTDKGDTPYNLRNCAYLDDFSKPKLMYADITQELCFCYCEEEMFCNNTTYFMIAKNDSLLPSIMRYLNSPLMNWYYRTISVQLGEKAVRMFSIYVLNIPIPKGLQDNIYDAYSLTPEEIDFIEHQQN